MRMNQDERRFDFHGLGAALKRAREEKGWTQAYVAELADRDSRTIMNIENKGHYPSFDLFVKLITMFDVSVDQFIHADGGAKSSSCRKHIDMLLNSMNEKELVVIEATAEGIKLRPAQQRAHFRLCSPVQFKVGLIAPQGISGCTSSPYTAQRLGGGRTRSHSRHPHGDGQ